jgi:Uma2 family endonuclease
MSTRMTRKTNLPWENIGELLEQLGDVPPERVRASPWPGTATENDVLQLERRTGRLFELVDGVLVEKVMGRSESTLSLELAWHVRNFLERYRLGYLAGADGGVRLMPGLVRYPDLSFFAWDDPANPKQPAGALAEQAPALAVEILSPGNTTGEMKRKLKEYFLGGCRLVWFVDPAKRTVKVCTSPDQSALLTEVQTLDGGDVLPGFELPLARLFAGVPQKQKRPRPRRK